MYLKQLTIGTQNLVTQAQAYPSIVELLHCLLSVPYICKLQSKIIVLNFCCITVLH